MINIFRNFWLKICLYISGSVLTFVIRGVVIPIIGIFGLFGNILSIFILCKHEMKSRTANGRVRITKTNFILISKISETNFILISKTSETRCIVSRIPCKVYIFWEGHKILWNLHHRFDRYYIGQIYGGDFAKFWTFSEYINFKQNLINII